ncbi:uncharacterized protein (TIGR02246 family) [Frondihabitans sp. PhB188]|uniref:SgcJ/EcaC family oxidoreductase n=1 Tax=Frondihabitans sp. PhB188 TaxID=2485200 RepID=UPI000F4A2C2F|nr:SgcJ/EcaC family oxidoreductase [Frondihabitans sp. PhB188]ROQ31040.1 uncharacterized protein (TIGR02246 family) [Frondihabitans sp. PhB188]
MRTPKIVLISTVSAGVLASAGYLAVLPETANAAPAQLVSHGVSTQEQSAALFDQWNAALATGDSKKVNALYSSDALLLPTVAAEMFDTSSERTGYFTHFLENNPSGIITESTSKRLGPGSIENSGLYTFTMRKTGQVIPARFTFIYEYQHGQWKIIAHHSSRVPEAN